MMALKNSKEALLSKNVNLLSGKKSGSHISVNDDSGYSSDSSSASAGSTLYLQRSNEPLNHFPTPDVNWKRNLRYKTTINSTPVNSKSLKELKSPNITPIEGQLLRSKTYPNYSPGCSSLLNLSLNISLTSDYSEPDTDKDLTKEPVKENEKKTSLTLRSPLKSPFKLLKRQKNTENSVEDVFANPDVKERTVKALFMSKDNSGTSIEKLLPKDGSYTSPVRRSPRDSSFTTPTKKLLPKDSSCTSPSRRLSPRDSFCMSPVRRLSPRLSNIINVIMVNASYLLPTIFSFLNDKDLLNISHVCELFKHTVEESTDLKKRKNLFVKKKKKEYINGKENVKSKCLVGASPVLRTSPRIHFQQLQNSALLQKAPSPKKPLSRFERFVLEGKKLLPGETQEKCIQCQYPARVFGSESKASCSNEKCAYVYCTRCHLPFHERLSECLGLMPKLRVSCASKLFSKACKKRLRRL